MTILGLTIAEVGTLVGLVVVLVSFVSWNMNHFIFQPISKSMDTLSQRIDEMNTSRKENERKLFEVTDDHTKEITRLEGQVNTISVIAQANTLRLNNMEK